MDKKYVKHHKVPKIDKKNALWYNYIHNFPLVKREMTIQICKNGGKENECLCRARN
jgi:hypothetical protein